MGGMVGYGVGCRVVGMCRGQYYRLCRGVEGCKRIVRRVEAGGIGN